MCASFLHTYCLVDFCALTTRFFMVFNMSTERRECVEFGISVRKLRKLKKLSQEELAGRSGLHRTYIGGIERGERNATIVTICQIASGLGVSPRDLF